MVRLHSVGNPSTTPSPAQQLKTPQGTAAPAANQTTPSTEPQLITLAPPQQSGIVTYGTPDPKTCGNGYELVTLSDAQYDASTSYAEGPNDQVKQQSRIDHMPSMGKVNNTDGRGGWCADHAKAVAKDTNQYLQLDLYSEKLIGMVETQGQYYYPNAVSKFTLSASNDGVNWLPYGKLPQNGSALNIYSVTSYTRSVRIGALPRTALEGKLQIYEKDRTTEA
ncbi:uncharacterized protein [Montipora capricornis]|uniref:uncharacterized protein n=1 Tax=Montipora capricornis TaxID=246305 RepID=UPI0035F21712